MGKNIRVTHTKTNYRRTCGRSKLFIRYFIWVDGKLHGETTNIDHAKKFVEENGAKWEDVFK